MSDEIGQSLRKTTAYKVVVDVDTWNQVAKSDVVAYLIDKILRDQRVEDSIQFSVAEVKEAKT